MRRMVAFLGMVLVPFLATPSAQAGQVAPVVSFDDAWLVGGGAAVEVAFEVTCPDPSDAGYRHAIVTNGHYLEFRCDPQPRRVTLLLPGQPPTKGQPLTLRTLVLTPQCLYWDSSELENGEQGCWKLHRNDTVKRLKPGAFVPESSVDLGSEVDITQVRRTRDGGVRLSARFSCVEGHNWGALSFTVRQRTPAGFVQAHGLADPDEVSCVDESFTRTFTVAPPADRSFRRGKVVVSAEWIEGGEGGPWAFDTGLHRLR